MTNHSIQQLDKKHDDATENIREDIKGLMQEASQSSSQGSVQGGLVAAVGIAALNGMPYLMTNHSIQQLDSKLDDANETIQKDIDDKLDDATEKIQKDVDTKLNDAIKNRIQNHIDAKIHDAKKEIAEDIQNLGKALLAEMKAMKATPVESFTTFRRHSDFPTDDRLWQLIALCAGTDGSILVIGSASGVALMGLENVSFQWYAKKVLIGAAVRYFAGIAAYLAQNAVHGGLFVGLTPEAVAVMDAVQQSGVIV